MRYKLNFDKIPDKYKRLARTNIVDFPHSFLKKIAEGDIDNISKKEMTIAMLREYYARGEKTFSIEKARKLSNKFSFECTIEYMKREGLIQTKGARNDFVKVFKNG